MVLVLVVGVEILEYARNVIENLIGAEEAIQLNDGVFGRIGRMDDVLLKGHTVVTTDGARGSLARVGRACHAADGLHGINTLVAATNYW